MANAPPYIEVLSPASIVSQVPLKFDKILSALKPAVLDKEASERKRKKKY